MMMTLVEPKFWQYLVMLAFTIYFSERRYSLGKTCIIAGICFVLIGVGGLGYAFWWGERRDHDSHYHPDHSGNPGNGSLD